MKGHKEMNIRLLNDFPDTKILVDTFNRYDQTKKTLTTFSIGLSGIHLHFSRYTMGRYPGLWASWNPTITQIKLLINTLTCPKEKLIPIALQEPKYETFHSRFIIAKVPTDRTIAREIAIARLERKL